MFFHAFGKVWTENVLYKQNANLHGIAVKQKLIFGCGCDEIHDDDAHFQWWWSFRTTDADFNTLWMLCRATKYIGAYNCCMQFDWWSDDNVHDRIVFHFTAKLDW